MTAVSGLLVMGMPTTLLDSKRCPLVSLLFDSFIALVLVAWAGGFWLQHDRPPFTAAQPFGRLLELTIGQPGSWVRALAGMALIDV